MFRVLACTAALVLLLPALVSAQEAEPDGGLEEGLNLLERGTEMLLRELLDQMEPALQGLRERIGDLNAYHPPEMLPNGDIIIRRRTPLDDVDDEGGVDL